MRHNCNTDGNVETMTEATALLSSDDSGSKPGLGQQPQADHPTAQATDTAQQHDQEQQQEEDHEAWKIRLIDR